MLSMFLAKLGIKTGSAGCCRKNRSWRQVIRVYGALILAKFGMETRVCSEFSGNIDTGGRQFVPFVGLS